MQQTINKKNDSIALSVAIVVHGLLLLLFWWIVAWVELDPPPPPSEEGVMINFGFSNQGGGDNYHNTEEVGGQQQSDASSAPQTPSSPPDELITGQDPTYSVPPQQNTTPSPNNNNQNTTPTPPSSDPRFSMNNNNNNSNNNNSNNAPDGPNDGPYNYGVIDGSPDSNGNSYGHNLSGWGWSREPHIDRETQAGVIYYEIQLDANGNITTATYLSKYSTINTPSVVDKYRKRLLECELEAVGRVAKVTKGVVMFTFKY